MSGCFSLHAVISWKLPYTHSKRSDNCSFPVNIAFSISSLDILIASVAVFPKFRHRCDWGTPVCGQFCLERLRCPLNEDCELKASELMNVSLLSEWRCLFRNKKVIPTSLRGPKFCLKKFTWIYLDFEFVVCFCKKFFAESKNGVVLKIFSVAMVTSSKQPNFLGLNVKGNIPRSQVPKNPVVHSKCTNYFLGLDTQLRGVTTLAKSPVVVSFDGSWSKWGYTANHCVGFVISAATGKVLDLEIISKTCGMCLQ